MDPVERNHGYDAAGSKASQDGAEEPGVCTIRRQAMGVRWERTGELQRQGKKRRFNQAKAEGKRKRRKGDLVQQGPQPVEGVASRASQERGGCMKGAGATQVCEALASAEPPLEELHGLQFFEAAANQCSRLIRGEGFGVAVFQHGAPGGCWIGIPSTHHRPLLEGLPRYKPCTGAGVVPRSLCFPFRVGRCRSCGT